MSHYLFLLLLTTCQSPAEKEAPFTSWSEPGFMFYYNLHEPDTTFKLIDKLDEISGLGMHSDGERLVAVQDEDGLIFYLDPKTGEETQRFKFWKDGDYEGVEMVDGVIYVVKSTGTVYAIHQPGTEAQEVEKYNGFLSGDNDVEGVAYDAANHRLLLACKAEAGEGKEYELTKAVYGFDLERMELDTTPAYLISLEQVHQYLKTDPAIRKLEKLWEFFAPDESEFGFSPSGVAIHPHNGDLYITSSVGKLLMVLSPEGHIRHIEKLKKKVHAQPEGICFDQNGGMYISNEGKDGKARLHYFPTREE